MVIVSFSVIRSKAIPINRRPMNAESEDFIPFISYQNTACNSKLLKMHRIQCISTFVSH